MRGLRQVAVARSRMNGADIDQRICCLLNDTS
jgi:hypothetical protein